MQKKYRVRSFRVIGKSALQNMKGKNIYGCSIPEDLYLQYSGTQFSISITPQSGILFMPVKSSGGTYV